MSKIRFLDVVKHTVCAFVWHFVLEVEFTICLSTLGYFCIRFRKIISWWSQLSSNTYFVWIKCIEKYKMRTFWLRTQQKGKMEEKSKTKQKLCTGKGCVFCLPHCFSGISLICSIIIYRFNSKLELVTSYRILGGVYRCQQETCYVTISHYSRV